MQLIEQTRDLTIGLMNKVQLKKHKIKKKLQISEQKISIFCRRSGFVGTVRLNKNFSKKHSHYATSASKQYLRRKKHLSEKLEGGHYLKVGGVQLRERHY